MKVVIELFKNIWVNETKNNLKKELFDNIQDLLNYYTSIFPLEVKLKIKLGHNYI
jgi:hypothetical protein